jgi:hypothetical protein
MTTSLVDAESVLAVDLGVQSTRALLFDVVDGQYNFIASGCAATTLEAPYQDVGEGVSQAILQLQHITGRMLISKEGQIILPSQASGAGVDRMVITYSAGPAVRMVIAGLLNDVSLSSAQHLAGSIYGQVVETIGMNDRRKPEAQVDAILKANPDLVLIAGGTEGGASRSVYKLVDLVNLTCRVLPQAQRPEVVYAGNQALAKRIQDNLEKWTAVTVVPNIRPSIDTEDLGPAQQVLTQTMTRLRMRNINGLEPLATITSAPPVPTASAFGRLVRFLGRALDPTKGVLGVDLGNGATILASARSGDLVTSVYPYGTGRGVAQVLEQVDFNEIFKWLPMPLEKSFVRDYLWQKSLIPDSLPQDRDTLAIEQAFARAALSLAYQQFQARYPEYDRPSEPILVSGGVFSQAPSAGHALLMLLDSLQPVGVTTFMLDQNSLSASLGAIASFNSVLPVQVLESGAFLNLGKVICPVSEARYGTPVVRVKIEYERGNDTSLEVTKGSIASLNVKPGQTARLYLQGINHTLIDPHNRKSSLNIKIVGGACGAVIDARDRPLVLPPDDARRRDLLKKWAASLIIS